MEWKNEEISNEKNLLSEVHSYLSIIFYMLCRFNKLLDFIFIERGCRYLHRPVLIRNLHEWNFKAGIELNKSVQNIQGTSNGTPSGYG